MPPVRLVMTEGKVAETSSIGDSAAQHQYVGGRTARERVPFLLPHLRPGMALLDCGCGVGSITRDLAALVAPGAVVGIDLDEGQLAVARAEAARRSLANVRFARASVYALPFPEGSFDVALAHTLLVHLSDPPRALRALRRVLKPGGVACVVDDDDGTRVWSPTNPTLDWGWDLWTRLSLHNGASPFYSRGLRGLLLAAGFDRAAGFAHAAEFSGTAAATRAFAGFAGMLLDNREVMNAPLVEVGLATWAQHADLREAFRVWGDDPGAFLAWLY